MLLLRGGVQFPPLFAQIHQLVLAKRHAPELVFLNV
jgi:hypothetical protein